MAILLLLRHQRTTRMDNSDCGVESNCRKTFDIAERGEHDRVERGEGVGFELKLLLNGNTQAASSASQILQRCEVGKDIGCDGHDAAGRHGPWRVGALG